MTIDDAFFEVLDKYERPKEIIFIPEFQQTATGKIIREQSTVLNKIEIIRVI
jgi:O-succinylbenzoic acid--CoA ligase